MNTVRVIIPIIALRWQCLTFQHRACNNGVYTFTGRGGGGGCGSPAHRDAVRHALRAQLEGLGDVDRRSQAPGGPEQDPWLLPSGEGMCICEIFAQFTVAMVLRVWFVS